MTYANYTADQSKAMNLVSSPVSSPSQPGKPGWRARPVDPEILRASDIRGIVGHNLNCETAYSIGRAFGTIVRACSGNNVCVGYDGRLSSPSLESALCEGLEQSGITVIRIGLCPSPMLYFAVHNLGAHGGIMVTGSHNPSEYNGFKMMLGTSSFHGADIQRLNQLLDRASLSNGLGRIIDVEVDGAYALAVAGGLRNPQDLKIAWDPGNGAAGAVLGQVLEHLPGEHFVINEDVDGRFPAHHPDPTVPENLVQLQDQVAKENCDLGIAFDGDGDRIDVVDSDGEILWGDQLMMLLAEQVVAERPGATIIADVKASDYLFGHITEIGGTPLMWKIGHSFIKSKMVETGAPLAGEMSGHIFFADRYFGFDDALYAAVRLLDALGATKRSLAECRRAMPSVVNTPELRFDCAESRKQPIMRSVMSALHREGAVVDTTDGVRVRTKDGWWLLRQSNTQAVLVARCEAHDRDALDRVKADLVDHLVSAGYDTSNVEA